MNKKIGILILALFCVTLALPFVSASDVELNIHGENPEVEVNAYSEGQGELVINYNGENVLETIEGLDNANMVYLMTIKEERDIEKLIDIFEEKFYNFTIYVDYVTNTLYTRDNVLATNIGFTDVNNTLVLAINDGETTIVTEIEVLKYQVSTISDIIQKNNEAIISDIQYLTAENDELKRKVAALEAESNVDMTLINNKIEILENRTKRAEESFRILDYITSIVVMIASVPAFAFFKGKF
jgi:hypothetical protein